MTTKIENLYVNLLSPNARLPVKGSDAAAGYDLCADLSGHNPDELTTAALGGRAVDQIWIEPGKRALVKTGIAIALPSNTYGRVAPRSGLAFKFGVDVLAGVIDEDYRGEVGVILINLGDSTFCVSDGERIAQLVIERIQPVYLLPTAHLPVSVRGLAGFGSTGV